MTVTTMRFDFEHTIIFVCCFRIGDVSMDPLRNLRHLWTFWIALMPLWQHWLGQSLMKQFNFEVEESGVVTGISTRIQYV